MADIVLDHVTKRFPDGTVGVDDLSLSVKHGEFMVLLGPSGCGKSTTLNLIAGLDTISDGELRIGGTVMNDKPPQQRDVAMVFQSYALYPHLSVRDNIGFALKLAKTPRSVIRRKVEDVARTLDLTPLLDEKPQHLSGGQRQRVAMGRAIVRDPSAFLLDEPLSNLDVELRAQMRTELSALQRRLGATMVYVTHDQIEAMTLGDRVAVLRDGALQQLGTPRELYERPANLFVAGFFGAPSMNLMPARLERDRLRTKLGDLPVRDDLRRTLERSSGGRDVLVGLRPESVADVDVVAVEEQVHGVVFTGNVDVLEAMGSDVYVYLDVADDGMRAPWPAGAGLAAERIVARLPPGTRIHEGQNARLWADARRVQVFDPVSGANLGPAVEDSAGSRREA